LQQGASVTSAGEEASIWDWLQSNTWLFAWLFALGIGSLIATALLMPLVVLRLPEDYFVATRSELARTRNAWQSELARTRNAWQWAVHVGKNALGVVFVLAGIAMLVLPGQGLLTIVIGLLLVDFPGKRAVELRIVRRPAILGFLNRLRERRGKPPLRVE
jgi:hypothetical protein